MEEALHGASCRNVHDGCRHRGTGNAPDIIAATTKQTKHCWCSQDYPCKQGYLKAYLTPAQ